MNAGIQFKVCGIMTAEAADFSVRHGASYLGFNFYPKSPRYLSPEKFREFAHRLPIGKKVAVLVEPTAAELAALQGLGFDFFQIHFRAELPLAQIAGWSKAVGPERLWLAPKLPPGLDLPAAWLPFARFFMLDTFSADRFGGTGQTGDWAKFGRHQLAYPAVTWILAGGLNPDNIGAALRGSGARFVDVSSGVESAPGVKDEAKVRAFAASLRR
jgi:phosphoribosylanthranilate isomerase